MGIRLIKEKGKTYVKWWFYFFFDIFLDNQIKCKMKYSLIFFIICLQKWVFFLVLHHMNMRIDFLN